MGEDKRLDDCTLVEIGPCKDCKRYNKNEMFCTWHSGELFVLNRGSRTTDYLGAVGHRIVKLNKGE